MIKYSEINKEELNSGKKIILFSAAWCKDCVALDAYIDNIVSENTEWKFIYVDTDKFPEMAETYNVMGIPSFVAKIEGEVVSDLISKDPKSEILVNSWIKTIGKI